MSHLLSPLIFESHRDLNVTRHFRAIEKDRYMDHDGQAYCMCEHEPTVIPVQRVIDGKKSEVFVAMCNACMPGGAMHLREHKAPYLALHDFDLHRRLTVDGGERHAI